MLYQAIQLLGAGMVLYAYALVQQGRVTPEHLGYIVLNLIGAMILLGIAVVGKQWGFCVLNAVWIVIAMRSIYAMIMKPRRLLVPATRFRSRGPKPPS